MPIPFILGALAAGAGAYGIKKGLDAKKDMNKAKSINEDAQKIANDTENKIDMARESTNEEIMSLGEAKIEILSGSLNDFVESFSRLKNVELSDSVGMEELRGFNLNSQDFIDIKDASFHAKELASGTAGSLTAGTLAAVGAYNATEIISVASTGAEVKNVTLASLDYAILSPPVIIFELVLVSEAQMKLIYSHANMDQAKMFQEQGENICSALNAIQDRATQIKNLLDELNYRMARVVSDIDNIIYDFGTDFRKFNRSAKETVGIAVQIAKTIKIVIDTPLLNEDGELNDYDTYNLVEDTQYLLDSGKI